MKPGTNQTDGDPWGSLGFHRVMAAIRPGECEIRVNLLLDDRRQERYNTVYHLEGSHMT